MSNKNLNKDRGTGRGRSGIGRRAARFALIIGILAAAAGSAAGPTLFERLCRLLGINPKLASAISRPRGGDEVAPHGKRVMMAAIDGKTAPRLLYDCGECWSPAVWRGDVTVVRSDGIWRIDRGAGTPKQVLAQKDIAVQIGALAEHPDTMLAMSARGAGDAAEYTLLTADLATGHNGPGPTDMAAVYRQTDVFSFPRPDAIRGNRILSTSRSRPLRLLIATVANESEQPLNNDLPLAPKPGVERFDPVWVDDGTIVYLERDI